MDQNQRIAYRYAEITQKAFEEGNDMAYFALLKGTGNARLESVPGEGHNYIAVIDGIHAFQNGNKKRNVRADHAPGRFRKG